MVGRRALLVLLIIIIVGSVSALTLWRSQQTHFVLRTRPGINLGSKQSGPYSPVGWLMPSDTRIATSYVANQSFDHNYMNAYVTVLSSSTYQLQRAQSSRLVSTSTAFWWEHEHVSRTTPVAAVDGLLSARLSTTAIPLAPSLAVFPFSRPRFRQGQYWLWQSGATIPYGYKLMLLRRKTRTRHPT